MKKILPDANVRTVKDYFELPKNKRTKFGLYLLPVSLPSDIFDKNVEGWTAWGKRIRSEFPIQGWFREWVLSYDNPVYTAIKMIIRNLNQSIYNVKRFINPVAPRMRKAWKRHEYMDICDAIRVINFALILDFWYDEVQGGYINWESTDEHVLFYNWIKGAVEWIETGRQIAENQYDTQLHIAVNLDRELSYDDRFKLTDNIEEYIRNNDTQILTQMMQYREFFWT